MGGVISTSTLQEQDSPVYPPLRSFSSRILIIQREPHSTQNRPFANLPSHRKHQFSFYIVLHPSLVSVPKRQSTRGTSPDRRKHDLSSQESSTLRSLQWPQCSLCFHPWLPEANPIYAKAGGTFKGLSRVRPCSRLWDSQTRASGLSRQRRLQPGLVDWVRSPRLTQS